MKHKYSLVTCTVAFLLLLSGGILRAQSANPLIHSVQFPNAPVNENGKDLLKDMIEDPSQRTLYSSTWKGKNGKVVIQYSTIMINYKDANGRLVPLDNTLRSDKRGWVADKQPNPCYFHSDRSTGINLGGDAEITFNKNCTVNGMPLDQHIASMDKNEVKMDLTEGVHKDLTFVTDGIKTDYIFDKPLDGGISVAEEVEVPHGAYLIRDVNSGTMTSTGWNGDYLLLSANGKLLSKFMAAECYDAKKHYGYATYSVEVKDGKNILTTTIPNEWLKIAQYPVTLDPLVVGATSHWTGGATVSCLYPNFHTDSILVTIPPKITITYFTIDYAYVSNVVGQPTPLSDGVFYLSTPCAKTDTLGCIVDTGGICYLKPYEDLHNPMTCCYKPSCSPQSFYLAAHLSRLRGGFGCDSSTIWYSVSKYAGFQYFFSAYVAGYTDSVNSLSYIPSSQCSNNCTLTMDATMLDGVPPYTVSHPWAVRDTIVGAYSGCASTGKALMKLKIPGANCPFTCLSPDTTITVPPPTVVDACGDTVKNLKAQQVTLKPKPVISATPVDSIVCSGLPVTLNMTSCVPGTTYNWIGSDNASGSGLSISDATADTSTTLPMKVTYKIIGNANGCLSDTITAKGVINPYPNATITGIDTLDLGKSETLTATGGGTYNWTPVTGLSCATCPNPVATPTITTTYFVNVTDSEGCSKIIPFTIIVLDENIIIPNVITPNGDNVNDLFVINGLQYYNNAKLTIYDRWGKQVYTSSNYKNDWNGGGQVDGVYYYVLVLPNAKKFDGYFQIIK